MSTNRKPRSAQDDPAQDIAAFAAIHTDGHDTRQSQENLDKAAGDDLDRALEAMRLPQDYGEGGAEKLLTRIPVRKPSKTEFVRVHHDPKMKYEAYVIEIKQEGEIYIIGPDLLDEVPEIAVPVSFHLAINRQKVPFLWPVRLPNPDGTWNTWHRSAADALNLAKDFWISVRANKSLGGYEVHKARGVLKDPEWPKETFQEIRKIAFKDRMITTIDHPVLRRLRGEI
jgi:hypothetical protein